MPALLIHVVNNSWVAAVANTNVQYTFAGGTQSFQETAVQQLAAAMQEGEDALVNGIPEIFQLPEGAQSAAVVNEIFGTTDQIILGVRPIYAAIGDDVLLDADVLEEAGEALALAL